MATGRYLGTAEGDLLFGRMNSQIATLVERHTRYAQLVKVAAKISETGHLMR